MIVVNFSHPLTGEQQARIEAITEERIKRLIEVACQMDTEQPFDVQIVELADQVGLSAYEWQAEDILVNYPALAPAAVAMAAELHGRTGHFPPALRLKRTSDTLPRFVVAEIVYLDAIRREARGATIAESIAQ